ncbi:hypothetical protein W97_02263 [Coniosporium apollinis CBS 100218]|uniref:Uncharacterized protein n=1 Tax=Coniosporium apollinis (strain CBS 100218) TaxID=1168221 RepID=R7YN23_CONA1|nr:uncharacterized protein W97_02263 [Coniosporium apollinis CBS 100218]EON63036.1 hypothetical protein W97_02263 [Coniosporium apollinis CBS 100218]
MSAITTINNITTLTTENLMAHDAAIIMSAINNDTTDTMSEITVHRVLGRGPRTYLLQHLTAQEAMEAISFALPIVDREMAGSTNAERRQFLRRGQRIMLTYLERAGDPDQDYANIPEMRETLAGWHAEWRWGPLMVYGYTAADVARSRASSDTDYDALPEMDWEQHYAAEAVAAHAVDTWKEALEAYKAIPVPDSYDPEGSVGSTETDEMENLFDA